MKQEYTPLQIALEILSFVGIAVMAIYLIIHWGSIPDKIPQHYNFAGQVDSWSSKKSVLFLPIVNVAMYILMTVVTFFPSIWNMPPKAVEKNKEMAYKMAKDILIITKFTVVVVFDYLTFYQINSRALSIWFLPAFVGVIVILTAVYIVKFNRIK